MQSEKIVEISRHNKQIRVHSQRIQKRYDFAGMLSSSGI